MFRLFILLFTLFFVQNSFAINPDFYRQKETKQKLKRQRERGAKAKTVLRKKEARAREQNRKGFTKVRKKLIRVRKQREKLHDKDLAEKKKFRALKVAQANRYAKTRRRKSKVSWKEQNLEYDIKVPVKKKDSAKKY